MKITAFRYKVTLASKSIVTACIMELRVNLLSKRRKYPAHGRAQGKVIKRLHQQGLHDQIQCNVWCRLLQRYKCVFKTVIQLPLSIRSLKNWGTSILNNNKKWTLRILNWMKSRSCQRFSRYWFYQKKVFTSQKDIKNSIGPRILWNLSNNIIT